MKVILMNKKGICSECGRNVAKFTDGKHQCSDGEIVRHVSNRVMQVLFEGLELSRKTHKPVTVMVQTRGHGKQREFRVPPKRKARRTEVS